MRDISIVSLIDFTIWCVGKLDVNLKSTELTF